MFSRHRLMSELLIILSILFFSTLIRSTFGFGDALIAMPLLSIFLDIQFVTPLVAIVAFTIAIYIVIKDFSRIEFKNIWRLIISSIVGIPVGLYYLKGINEELVKIVLGLLIVVFASYNLLKPEVLRLTRSIWAYVFGFFAGIIGAAYNTNGPIIVIYGTTQKWNPIEFRATLQGYFLTTGVFVVVGHFLAGNFKTDVLTTYLYALPVVLISILIGTFLNKKIKTQSFIKLVYAFLLLIGVVLLTKSGITIFSS